MKKVYYLSVTSFSDTDLGVLKYLSGKYQVTYGAILQKNNANFTQDELAAYCEKYNIKFEPFLFKYQQKDVRTFFTFLNIVRKIKASNPDLIYIASFDHVFFSLLSFMLDKNKTIVALHDVEFHSNADFKKILIIARKLTLSHFINYQVFSRAQYDVFKQLSPTKKITFIPSPLKDFGAPVTMQNRTDGQVNLLFFGNILPYKGLDILLEALSELSTEKGFNFNLIIAGRCNDWDSTYEPLVRNNVKIEKMIGFIDNRQIPDLFTKAQYLVLPYKDATQSGPLKIAFHYNLPIIASDIPSFSEDIVDRVDGYLFKNGDYKSLEGTLREIMNKHNTTYNKIKQEQKKYVDATYQDSVIAKQFIYMFDNVIAENK
jgi:glycosyltransferase involved in cell wall biosynthesis